MSSSTWTPHAVASEAFRWDGTIWRIVESQHVASTMKVVDDADEQAVLEALLEGSKPLIPREAAHLDYLLATPFRYWPRPGGSRFRAVGDPGVFYGAEDVRTAAAEVGYWRWRFLKDAVSLARLGPVPHTAFSAEIGTLVIDLQAPPFSSQARLWEDPADYASTQALASVAREAKLGAIQYRSVRASAPAWCMAVLEPGAFAKPAPNPVQQTWYLAVSPEQVTWRSTAGESFMQPMTRWL